MPETRRQMKFAKILGMDQEFWVDKESMANAVAFKSLSNQYIITYDNAVEDTFLVHTKGGIVKFSRTREGLCGFKFSREYMEQCRDFNTGATQQTETETN